MNIEANKHDRQIATFIHLSTFAKYFIPFGNFILPLLLWMSKRKEDLFIDSHGKQALNFQLSMFIYKAGLFLTALPFVGWQIFSFVSFTSGMNMEYEGAASLLQASGLVISIITIGTLYLALFTIDLVMVIIAATRAHKGLHYKYPLSIPFLRETEASNA